MADLAQPNPIWSLPSSHGGARNQQPIVLTVHQIDTQGSQIEALKFWIAVTFDGDFSTSNHYLISG